MNAEQAATTTPWPAMWPCWKCGGPGRRNLGTQGWCERHLGELFATFSRSAWESESQFVAALTAATHDQLLKVPDDADEPALVAWGERLRRGVDAGVITRDEASRAWRRAVRHVAA